MVLSSEYLEGIDIEERVVMMTIPAEDAKSKILEAIDIYKRGALNGCTRCQERLDIYQKNPSRYNRFYNL